MSSYQIQLSRFLFLFHENVKCGICQSVMILTSFKLEKFSRILLPASNELLSSRKQQISQKLLKFPHLIPATFFSINKWLILLNQNGSKQSVLIRYLIWISWYSQTCLLNWNCFPIDTLSYLYFLILCFILV